jgi:thymidylate kinase
MQSLKRGILIAIEGIDGSGKSVLAKNLSDSLSSQ